MAFIAGDIEAAKQVELDLPQTGVCNSNRVVAALDAEAACCTPTTTQGTRCAPKSELPEDAPCCGTADQKVSISAEPAE